MINRHLIVLAILASACGKAPGIAGPLDAATATTDSPEAMFPHAITSFGFRTQDNQDLRSDVDATITAMTINVTVPLVDITALKPRFTFDGSSVCRRNGAANERGDSARLFRTDHVHGECNGWLQRRLHGRHFGRELFEHRGRPYTRRWNDRDR